MSTPSSHDLWSYVTVLSIEAGIIMLSTTFYVIVEKKIYDSLRNGDIETPEKISQFFLVVPFLGIFSKLILCVLATCFADNIEKTNGFIVVSQIWITFIVVTSIAFSDIIQFIFVYGSLPLMIRNIRNRLENVVTTTSYNEMLDFSATPHSNFIRRNLDSLNHGKTRFVINQNMYDFETCSICWDTYKVKDNICTLTKCGHSYHEGCISNWLCLHRNCPICREDPFTDKTPVESSSP